jgi:signal transduction histidine kinase
VIRNAIQYSPPGHDVDVDIADRPGAVSVAIRDYGCGVPEAMEEEIFEPFVRVDASRQFATGGAGLGLAIVKRIVVAHAGTVRAENARPGLRIRVVLPVIGDTEGTASARPGLSAA